MNIIEVNFG